MRVAAFERFDGLLHNILGVGDEELVAKLENGAAVWDDVVVVALDEHDQRMWAVWQIGEGHVRHKIVFLDDLLHKDRIRRVAFFQRAEHEDVVFLEDGAPFRHHFFLAAAQRDKDGARRQRDIHHALTDPGVARLDAELDEIDRRFIHIVGEGFENVAALVDHVELFRNNRQQRALKCDGKQHHDKHDVEKIVFHRNWRDHSDDRKHDRRRAAQARKGHEHSARQTSAKRRHEDKRGHWARDEGEEKSDRQRRQDDIDHLRWKREQPQQEKQRRVENARHAVEKRHDRFALRQLAVPQEQPDDIHAEKSCAAKGLWHGVARQRNGNDEDRHRFGGFKQLLLQHPARQKPDAKTKSQTDAQLHDKHQPDLANGDA